jgi:hypothetical protein
MLNDYPFDEKITATVKKYKKADGTDDKSAVRDILTDLLHFCNKHNIDFNERLLGANEVFDQEIDSEL